MSTRFLGHGQVLFHSFSFNLPMKTFPAFGTKSSFDVLPLFFAGAVSTGSDTASSIVVFGAISFISLATTFVKLVSVLRWSPISFAAEEKL